MKQKSLRLAVIAFCALGLATSSASAQIGRRFPSEKKVVADPLTGTPLTFLTSISAGDEKIYQTHQQWTADGKWVIFRSRRAPGQAMAVNEVTGAIVQVTEKGYMGMLCNARHSMKLYFMHEGNGGPGRGRGSIATPETRSGGTVPATTATGTPADGPRGRSGRNRPRGPFQIVEVDLARVFADSEAGAMKPASEYERVCGTTPEGMTADGNMGLDANEDFVYFRVGGDYVVQHLAPGTKIEGRFGPRGMGAGPTGLASMNLKTGEVKWVVGVGFQIGHVQTNPWMPGEIVFCWETGGKAPQRTWTVMADGTGLRPVYPEASYDWVTHEAVITKDEVAIAILAHRRPGVPETDPGACRAPASIRPEWGSSTSAPMRCALSAKDPLATQAARFGTSTVRRMGVGPLPMTSNTLWLIDRHTGEMLLLADLGEKTTAADHIHPTFSLDSTRIEIQCAMLSADDRSLNICVVPVPKTWLNRTYSNKATE